MTKRKNKKKDDEWKVLDQNIAFNKTRWKQKLLISTPTEGWIRFEWAYSRFAQVIPINWEASGFDINFGVMNYSVADAYNIIVKKAIEMEVEWLLLIEDDVLIPADFFLRINEYVLDGTIPVVSGLYFTKSDPAEPLIFRGRGNGPFTDWKLGQKVWVDGLPMGALLIHMNILRYVWNKKKKYKTPDGVETVEVFETPRKVFFDPETTAVSRIQGTQDLYFFDELMKNDVLKRTGFPKVARRKWPLLCDTGIFCKHIDRQTGKQYPT